MKFKYLIIVFNLIIIFFLSAIALLPLFVLGAGFAASLWRGIWPIALILVLFMLGLNTYFLMNYRFFRLLDREDWPALAYYLEDKVLVKGDYNSKKVRLLANSYLILCDFSSISVLEDKALITKPSAVSDNSLIFAAARILNGRYREAVSFLETILEKEKVKEEHWVRWFLGFSQMLDSNFDKSEEEFKDLAEYSNDAIVTGISAYFLATVLSKQSLKPEECLTVSENGRVRVKKAFEKFEDWKKEVDKAGSEVHTAIIRKYINEAGSWLFS